MKQKIQRPQQLAVSAGRVHGGRAGEHAVLPATLVGTGTLQFDLSLAPVPPKSYSANAAAVVADDTYAYLLFGFKRMVGSGLRSMLTVCVARSALAQIVDSLDQLKPMQQKLAEMGVKSGEPMTVQEEPAQQAQLTANAVYAGLTNEDACIDFYYVSPSALENVPRARGLGVVGQVRVHLPTSLLFMVWDELQRFRGTRLREKQA